MFSKQTYIDRRAELRSLMRSGGIVLIPGHEESPSNYPNNAYHFRQDSTFLYLFGNNKVAGLFAVMDLDSGEDMLFGDDFSMDDIIWMGQQPLLKELGASVGVERVMPSNELAGVVSDGCRRGRRIHFLPPYRPAVTLRLSGLLGINPYFVTDYISVELALAVVAIRSIKSAQEIEQIEDACHTGYLMHTTAMKMAREGVVEQQIAGAIEGIAMSYGSGVSFPSIVSQNGETLHNHSYHQPLTRGRLLLVDAGAENNMNYCSDYTRTFPVGGKFSSIQADIYNIVLAANTKGFEVSAPNVLYRDVHLASVRVIVEGLKELGVIKGSVDDAIDKGAHALFMPHGLGHMLGLDVHDMEDIGEKYVGYDLETERSAQLGLSSLRMGRKLQPGMVMTVEPGIYFIPAYIAKWRSEGINRDFINFDKAEKYLNFGGIRIEDDILITPEGNRMLGRERIPVTIEQIEDFMRD